MRVSAYPFARLGLFYLSGIMFYAFVGWYAPWLWYILFGLGILYVGLLHFAPMAWRVWLSPYWGMMAMLMLILVGVIRSYLYDARHYAHHVVHLRDSIQAYKAVIVSEVEPKSRSYKMLAEVAAVCIKGQWKTAHGKVMLYIRRDTTAAALRWSRLGYGDVLLVQGSFGRVPPPANPEMFDYRQFLAYQNIFHQHFTPAQQCVWLAYQPPNPVWAASLWLRKQCTDILYTYIHSPREYAIAVALLLGVREQMDEEISDAYSNTGLMHVLAVSGMHIGLLVWAFAQFFGAMKRSKSGTWIYTASLIAFLWVYGFVTGLSPSILRAVVMFTFVALGQASAKRGQMYNTLALSAMLLLFYNPMYLFSVGFQLSYAAVLGILYLVPKMEYAYQEYVEQYQERQRQGSRAVLWRPPHLWGLHYVRELVFVSIAAQIATFPIGLYNFHQFPNYFLLANLLIIPISTLALYAGIITLLLGGIPYLSLLAQATAWLTEWLIWAMNMCTFWLEDLPYALSSGVVISAVEMWLLYLWLLMLFRTFEQRRLVYWALGTGALVVLSASQLYRSATQLHQQQLVLYVLPHQSIALIQQGRNTWLIGDSAAVMPQADFYLSPHWDKLGSARRVWQSWAKASPTDAPYQYASMNKTALLMWRGKNILILRGKIARRELSAFEGLTVDYVWLQRNALSDIDEALQYITAHQWIADASNTPRRRRQWQQQAQRAGINFYDAPQQGAWILL